MTYTCEYLITFIETPIFTEDVTKLLSEESYSDLQQYLAKHPTAGTVITDTGGLRKVRWGVEGKGKRGGTRIIYYYLSSRAQIRLLFIYKKGTQENLTEKQKQVLRKLNERW